MELLTFERIMKQVNNRTLLKDFQLVITEAAQIGIKLSKEESAMMLDLIQEKQLPSSGRIIKQTEAIFIDRQDDGLYHEMSVHGYLSFFQKIAGYREPLEQEMAGFSLSDVWQTKIDQLTNEQKKRVSLFRMFLFSPKLVIIENPLSNSSDEGIELYLRALERYREKKIAVVVTSNYIEDLLLLSDDIYRYDSMAGLEKTDLANDSDQLVESSASSKPVNVFKVSSKVADKTIFFSPDEIDFIESINSVSYIRIGDEQFPTDLTLNQLEERLIKFGFFRCHRSYLVNLQRVSELISYSKNSYTLILKGQKQVKLPLSRGRIEDMKQLIEF
ncbi:ABC-2 type transport system ATP-binding protein [Amphibacillus marinus]|uniref:ABC-2 type transport system ATP-binding protein n=1 Tax=Amphibacillus marinus TaxID=872970 RepID=A0A1H8PQG4_9BACI|nr:LytTR family transcriptional regulator DNA-binding domain-containing protein [Amphibacillus marinus]SEO44200.1 ABC-2 type transport system ATP-binding protein [Amphibacillus marinus]